MIQVHFLETPFTLRVGVVKNPLVPCSRHIGVMAAASHGILADRSEMSGVVFQKIKGCSTSRGLCPGADVRRIAPDEMRGTAGRIDNEQLISFRKSGKHAGDKTTGRYFLPFQAFRPPSVQKCEAGIDRNFDFAGVKKIDN